MDHEDDRSKQSASDDEESTSNDRKLPTNKVTAKNATIPDASKGNELTHLIPGYTAPMRLETKTLKGITDISVTQLRKQAEAADAVKYTSQISILNKSKSTFDSSFATKTKTPSSIAIQKSNGNRAAFKIPTSFSSSYRNKPTKQNDNTAGRNWFGMTPTPMSDSLKTDLTLIRNRNYLDPKKFYKSADSFDGKVLQLGTVIEGPSEFYSSRLVKRERRQNFTEEIMADAGVANYAKRKFGEVQAEKERKRDVGRGKKGKFMGKKRR
jgi:hypothetical protein